MSNVLIIKYINKYNQNIMLTDNRQKIKIVYKWV